MSVRPRWDESGLCRVGRDRAVRLVEAHLSTSLCRVCRVGRDRVSGCRGPPIHHDGPHPRLRARDSTHPTNHEAHLSTIGGPHPRLRARDSTHPTNHELVGWVETELSGSVEAHRSTIGGPHPRLRARDSTHPTNHGGPPSATVGLTLALELGIRPTLQITDWRASSRKADVFVHRAHTSALRLDARQSCSRQINKFLHIKQHMGHVAPDFLGIRIGERRAIRPTCAERNVNR